MIIPIGQIIRPVMLATFHTVVQRISAQFHGMCYVFADLYGALR